MNIRASQCRNAPTTEANNQKAARLYVAEPIRDENFGREFFRHRAITIVENKEKIQ
jgi:hypothetical protein